MGKKAERWTPPCQDETVDMARAMTGDPEDPRLDGKGPCGAKHKEKANLLLEEKPAETSWGNNAYSRWMDCARCGARLAFWPKAGWTGKFRVSVNREVVMEALTELMAAGHWQDLTASDVKAKITEIEGRIAALKSATKEQQKATREAEKAKKAEEKADKAAKNAEKAKTKMEEAAEKARKAQEKAEGAVPKAKPHSQGSRHSASSANSQMDLDEETESVSQSSAVMVPGQAEVDEIPDLRRENKAMQRRIREMEEQLKAQQTRAGPQADPDLDGASR